MSSFETEAADGFTWRLLYTKPHAEVWVDANLRKQGFGVLLPRITGRNGLAPLFPRYVFAGVTAALRGESLGGTYGVQYVVQCGHTPARVPAAVIAEIRARMDAHGIVRVDRVAGGDPLFAKQRRERLAALEKFAAAGFRVRIA